jgi:hypothetical protein
MTDIELAWAAGFFEGDGSACVRHQRGGTYARASAGQMDRRVLDRFQRIVGIGKVYGPYKDGRYFDYRAENGNAHRLLALLLPFFGPVKREQAERVMRDAPETHRRARGAHDPTCRRGHTERSVWADGRLHCDACRRRKK